MTIATYAGLVTAVTNVVNRPDMVAMIPDWIYLCEQELNIVLHRREMAQRATAVTVPDQASYSLPDDFGEAIAMHVDTSPITVLDPGDWDRIVLTYQTTGQPRQWCINQNEFLLGPTPDAAYPLELYYYRTLPNLSGAMPTNWLLTAYPKVYLYGALCEAASSLVDDPRGPKWTQTYQRSVALLLKDQIRDRGLGGGPVLRADLPLTGIFNVFSGDYQ